MTRHSKRLGPLWLGSSFPNPSGEANPGRLPAGRHGASMEAVKAIVYERYGPPDVLEMREVETPVPGDRDLLIKVEAASVNRSDWEGLIGKPLYARMHGLRRPHRSILGSDVAGRVEAVGSAVESFRPGDEVFGDVMYHGERLRRVRRGPGDGAHRPQACRDHLRRCLDPPPGRSHRPPGHVGEDRAGDRILVNGAGGGTGAFAVQMAKAAEAEATGVDNGFKQDFMRSGCDHVLDYTQTDYTNTGNRYDLILDLVCERSIFAIRRAVARRPLCGGWRIGAGRLVGRHRGQTPVDGRPEDRRAHGAPQQRGPAHGGRYGRRRRGRTTIERTYPLNGVPEALRHLGEGRASESSSSRSVPLPP